MIGEINIYGLYFPLLLLLAFAALVLARTLGRLCASLGLYRFVWHPALFDLALFVIVLGLLNFLFSAWVLYV